MFLRGLIPSFARRTVGDRRTMMAMVEAEYEPCICATVTLTVPYQHCLITNIPARPTSQHCIG